MASAPGTSSRSVARWRSGNTRCGRPDGSSPTTRTPAASPSKRKTKVVARRATTSAAGIPRPSQRCGEPPPQPPQHDDQSKAEAPGQHRRERDVAQVLHHKPEPCEEVSGRAVDAQEVWHLANDRDAHKPFDETAHYWRRDEGRYPAHAQRAEEQEESADQYSQRGRERVEVGSPLYRDATHRYRRDQARCGIWADEH